MKPIALLLTCVIGLAVPLAGLAQPTIPTQPKSQSVSVGADVRFSVRATGTAPFTYQWRFKEMEIPGATTTLLSVTNVQVANAGNYTVVVSDAGGSITSEIGELKVDATLQKSPPALRSTRRRHFLVAPGLTTTTMGFPTCS